MISHQTTIGLRGRLVRRQRSDRWFYTGVAIAMLVLNVAAFVRPCSCPRRGPCRCR